MQWAVSLGRIDLIYATVFLSWYRPAPWKVHIDKIQYLYGYLNKYTYTSIKFNTEMPAYDNFKTIKGNWCNLYAVEHEDFPHSCLPPMGKPFLISRFFDANLIAYMTTGRSHTGITNLLNKTHIEWYSKLQSCVGTATYGSEYSATRIFNDHIVDLRNTLHYSTSHGQWIRCLIYV